MDWLGYSSSSSEGIFEFDYDSDPYDGFWRAWEGKESKASAREKMERNEGIIRWSPNPTRDEFMTINLNQRIVQLYEAKGYAEQGLFEYEKTTKHNEFPPLSTYDWSPANPGLVAMGTSRGEIHLLRVDDNSNDSLILPLKLQRACHSVAFNTTGLLAVGLERVRNDQCLQIWDLNQRLAGWDPKKKGWASVPAMNIEPKKLEASITITSVRFFEDQPQTLVVGVKNQCVRIIDLRDPTSTAITFQTRCNNNLGIDYADPNYFASSSLDQPGLVVWDKRASGRPSASSMYVDSVDREEVPWGAVLKLDRAIDADKNTYIRQLRYSRDQRGTLAVLSSAGQLQVLQTKKEYMETLHDSNGSPELLEVKKSYELEHSHFDPDHRSRFEDRLVSFDWLTLGTFDLPGRIVGLRANGSFEILGMPAPTSGLLSKLIPWKPPHALGESRLHLVQLKDPKERVKLVGPLVATEEKASMPVFGPEKFTSKNSQSNLAAAVKQSLQWNNDLVANLLDSVELKNSPKLGDPVGESLEYLLAHLRFPKGEKSQVEDEHGAHSKLQSSLELHDNITASTEDQLDSKMLRRAKLGYLFDCKTNILIVKDDTRLQSVWEWIHGAQEAAKHDGMVAGSLDLSYLGVYSVWMNFLGEKSKSRLIDSTIIPDASQWEHLISSINKRADRPTFNGVETSKPQHRQLCLAICGLVRTTAELDLDLKDLEEEGRHTTAAAWALFEGFPKRAVEILKKGRTDLLFIAMALDIKLNSSSAVIDAGEWSKALEDHPQMAEDPYLRAIYGYISSGNWEAIANETALPLLDRVGLALRKFGDAQLTEWLSKQMEEAIRTGDIEGIVLAGITDHTADILAKYVEKFMEYQTATLIMSFCHPRYIDDARCKAWHKAYRDFLQRHKEYILRVKFEQQSNIKSRSRDGVPVNRPPPRQITIRCLKCDTMTANDLGNSGALLTSAPGPSSIMSDDRNQLAVTGGIAGLCCPKCGSHLGRCAICMEVVGVPRSDRPEQSNDPNIRRMANFPTFCLKCKHVTHMDHSVDWLSRHTECPVPECRCQCNQQ